MSFDIEELTEEFFSRHWNDPDVKAPRWSEPWPVTGQPPIPNGTLQGCYCLYQGIDLVYVGLGASRGSGLYQRHGIGNRLYSHVLRVDKSKPFIDGKGFYKPSPKWPDISHLRTIGFASEYSYLAPALELFLLNCLPAELKLRNTQRPGYAKMPARIPQK